MSLNAKLSIFYPFAAIAAVIALAIFGTCSHDKPIRDLSPNIETAQKNTQIKRNTERQTPNNDDFIRGTFTDPRDGKTYRIVRIGSYTWMAKNLKRKAEYERAEHQFKGMRRTSEDKAQHPYPAYLINKRRRGGKAGNDKQRIVIITFRSNHNRFKTHIITINTPTQLF